MALVKAVEHMEDALAGALRSVTEQRKVDRKDLESILKLIIKKEILLEFLLEEGRKHEKTRKPHKPHKPHKKPRW
ncbi:hypothetical protein ACFP7A_01525 [Sporolactobacillus kofuensis]|uniref:Uncharacterized protein n=1 Tax=Sporolactobacillus kofuensis TaxID=269672 RepID=A0ABW1WA73_9BACL|nr:hypothetical protein [Sporolactobacillus kofuensis]MCO7175984.1 hypothetical protein [Sporolactobacillus kofuensis]